LIGIASIINPATTARSPDAFALIMAPPHGDEASSVPIEKSRKSDPSARRSLHRANSAHRIGDRTNHADAPGSVEFVSNAVRFASVWTGIAVAPFF
jgi:hypothetical protein